MLVLDHVPSLLVLEIYVKIEKMAMKLPLKCYDHLRKTKKDVPDLMVTPVYKNLNNLTVTLVLRRKN